MGVPDPDLGERVGAVVVPKPNESVALEDIVEFLQGEHIAVFKLPERLLLLDELPRNPVGKVLRHELTALFDSAEAPSG